MDVMSFPTPRAEVKFSSPEVHKATAAQSYGTGNQMKCVAASQNHSHHTKKLILPDPAGSFDHPNSQYDYSEKVDNIK